MGAGEVLTARTQNPWLMHPKAPLQQLEREMSWNPSKQPRMPACFRLRLQRCEALGMTTLLQHMLTCPQTEPMWQTVTHQLFRLTLRRVTCPD